VLKALKVVDSCQFGGFPTLQSLKNARNPAPERMDLNGHVTHFYSITYKDEMGPQGSRREGKSVIVLLN